METQLRPQPPTQPILGPSTGQKQEIWIETKTADGKSYYYHSVTRESSWTKPEGVIVLTQEQFNASLQKPLLPNPTVPTSRALWPSPSLLGPHPSRPPVLQPTQQPNMTGAFPRPLGTFGRLPPPLATAQPPVGLSHPLVPVSAPLLVPPQVPNLLGLGDPSKASSLLRFINPEIVIQAAEWVEFKTPEGKPYYFSNKTKQSVWEKPKVLLDYEAALEKAKKESMLNNGNTQSSEVRNSTQIEFNKMDSGSTESGLETKKEAQQQDKSKPVSSTPVSGTPWCVVWTGDNRVFFYNPSTKTSVWERPPDLADRPDVDRLVKNSPSTNDATVNNRSAESKDHVRSLQSNNNEQHHRQETQNESSTEKRKSDKSDREPTSVEKKPKKEHHHQRQQQLQQEAKKENDKEAEAARLRESLPFEERVSMFRKMLEEKDVSAFSTWEKELHKIVFDQRYLLLTSKERKSVFDDYVKDRAEQEREERRKQYKKARQDFKTLLEEHKVTTKTRFTLFCQAASKDDRFKAIEKISERESLFNEYQNDLRRREREEKNERKERYRKEFMELLREVHEKEPFEKSTRWSDVKDDVRNDSRYKTIESSGEREELFYQFLSTHVVSVSSVGNDKEKGDEEDGEAEDEQHRREERETKERIEASLREREKEVARELSSHMKEREKEQEKLKRTEAIETFTALLIDLIRSDDYSWREAKKIVKKDKRIELCNVLSREEKEKLFDSHIESLVRKKREKFRELLSEVKGLDLKSEWRDVRRLIKDDARYLKFSTSDRKCEREFREYLKDRLILAKNEFRQLLRETKILTYKSKKMIDESDQHLQDIIAVLQNDQRYLVLDCAEDERREILMEHIEELDLKGPPPPPTASEPPTNSSKKHK